MSEGDRAWFVQELIAALQEQGELAPGLFSGSELQPLQQQQQQQAPTRADLAIAAYEQLQFDFPLVSERELKALAEVYRSFASSTVSDGGSVADFALTRTLVEGVAYLNERNDGGVGSTSRSEESSILAAAVLLDLVRYFVEKRGSAKVRALMAKLDVPDHTKDVDPTDHSKQQQQQQQQQAMMTAPEGNSGVLEEKYAAQEDPDDLSEVYEGGELSSHHLHFHPKLFASQPASQPPSPQIRRRLSAELEYEKKLLFLASHTFSSSLAALSVDKWLEWELDDAICCLARRLVDSDSDIESCEAQDRPANGEGAFFGPAGEWTRYLYILRDRLLRFPASGQRGIQCLKSLVEHFQSSRRKSSTHYKVVAQQQQQQPHHVVYRIFAELVVSKEFQQRSSQRAQENLAAAILSLLPLIVEELQLLSPHEAAGHGTDLVAIFLQLLHFLVLTAADVRAMAQNLHESGVLRTMLTLLPSTEAVATAENAAEELAVRAWLRPLFRLVGECALWHEGVAVYVSRVPRAAALLPSLPSALPAEAVVLRFAFHQHRVDALDVDIWELFASPALFPPRCENFLDAMEKLQDAVFVLDALAAAVPSMRASVRAELRQHVQKVYAGVFPGAFEYPLFIPGVDRGDSATATSDPRSDEEKIAPDHADRTHDSDRGRPESLRFELLRNKLRQVAKALLLALTPERSGETARLASSKLD